MKQIDFFKKTLLLVAMVAGVNTTWADNVSIPQDLGSYIVIGSATGADGFASYITKTNCQVDSRLGDAGNSKYYTIGSTRNNTTVSFAITATAGDYVFGFKSGASGCASVVTVKMTKSGSEIPMFSQDVTITDDGNWDPNISHVLHITGVESADYTLSFDVKEITSGSYAGNFGNFYFHKMNQLAWPTSSSYMELSDGTFKNARDNNDNVINYISRTGGYIDDLLIYNDTEHDYLFCFNIDSKKQDAKVKITVSDFDSDVQEAQSTIIILAQGDYKCPLSAKITTGLKKVRFDFLDNDETADDSYLFNFRQVYFESYTYEALPLIGIATLNLNQSTAMFNACSYESGSGKDNIGNVKGTTPYADNYYVFNSYESAGYDLYANISWHMTAGSTLKVTVSNVETGAIEATGTSSSIDNTGVIHFSFDNAITSGAKKIRFDFVHATETSNYLFNVKEVSFYKRSLNEAEDYTPVAATGVDITLTRSITADKWSTICLPFNMTADQVTTTFGSGVKLAGITGYNSGNKQITTAEATTITANVPCFIKVASDFTSATIENVTIATGTPEKVISGDFKLVGTYSTMDIPNECYFVSNNNLYKSTGSSHIKPFRAYFTGVVPAGARIMFWDDEDVTAVTEVRSNMDDVKGEYFDLQGRKVTNPTKGLYIVNGKKVILK